MKLTTMTQVTVDGVMQGNGPADVDREWFRRDGWAFSAGDNETMSFVTQTYQQAGHRRRTVREGWAYELFVGSWGASESSRKPTRRA